MDTVVLMNCAELADYLEITEQAAWLLSKKLEGFPQPLEFHVAYLGTRSVGQPYWRHADVEAWAIWFGVEDAE